VSQPGGGAAAGGSYLAEVAEADAVGTTAEIYSDIRRVLGLPLVNLVYRHLAADPPLLERTWQALGPNLGSRAAAQAARRLVALAAPSGPVTPIPAAALAAVGLDAPRATLVRATLGAYARANSRNLLGMYALLDGCPGTGELEEEIEPSPPGEILPMARLDALPGAIGDLLDAMSRALVGDDEPRLVPSLLRHFADDAPLLALFWTVLRPAIEEELPARREALSVEGRSLAASLPNPVPALEDRGVRDVVGRFAPAIPALLFTGEALRAALVEAP
jgi:hypothetical protein